MRRVPDRERGVALLTVLLLVAVMATIAVGVLDDVRFGLRRSANMAAMAQARWYAIGAETFAGLQIGRLAQSDPARTTLAGDWNGRTFRFPIDGGVMTTRVRDGGNCFNVNVFAATASEREEAAEAEEEAAPAPVETAGGPPIPFERRQFAALLAAIDAPDRDVRDVVDAVADFIDPDSQRTGSGWEDDRYAQLPAPYRTAGGPLSEVSELRAVIPVTPELYAAMRPYLCALPFAGPAKLNVNTLTENDAVLLTALTAGAMPTATARRVLAARPEAGWESAEQFWATPVLTGVVIPAQARGQIDVRTRYFALEVRVLYLDSEATSSALLENVGGDRVTTRLRRWTIDE
jgi:general secretion pathway protein K